VYEGLITSREGMQKKAKYTDICDALDAGIALLGKYYDETDVSPLVVLSTGMSQNIRHRIMISAYCTCSA
jgi:hypothetical protein